MTLRKLNDVRRHFINGISRITHFWGFPKAMGATYAAIYLSPVPMSLDAIVEAVGVTKGGLVGHLRALERLGVVDKEVRSGDRKDYYVASADFWAILRRILREREKREFDRALRSVEEALTLLDSVSTQEDPAMVDFYRTRLGTIQSFFKALDRIVMTVLAMDSFRSDVLERFVGQTRRKDK